MISVYRVIIYLIGLAWHVVWYIQHLWRVTQWERRDGRRMMMMRSSSWWKEWIGVGCCYEMFGGAEFQERFVEPGFGVGCLKCVAVLSLNISPKENGLFFFFFLELYRQISSYFLKISLREWFNDYLVPISRWKHM